MNDTIVSLAQGQGTESPRWLLLTHQLPPVPGYLRVKVRRRLENLGAIPVKNSVYALPARDDTREDFEWLLREIVQDGGEATLCEAAFIDGVTDARLRGASHAETNDQYSEIVAKARNLATMLAEESDLDGEHRDPVDGIVRLKCRFAEVAAVDFFGAAGRTSAEQAISAVEMQLHALPAATSDMRSESDTAQFRGRTWVTRQGVHVDRIASAWLIRRFIDPDARFKFVPSQGYEPAPGELRFDMFEGEFTHEGDRCTFETLLVRFALDDRALHLLAEIVHDLDQKDEKFGRAEGPGLASLLSGMALSQESDAIRI
jgi:hypothetical protein